MYSQNTLIHSTLIYCKLQGFLGIFLFFLIHFSILIFDSSDSFSSTQNLYFYPANTYSTNKNIEKNEFIHQTLFLYIYSFCIKIRKTILFFQMFPMHIIVFQQNFITSVFLNFNMGKACLLCDGFHIPEFF